MSRFKQLWEALKDRRKATDLDTLTISNALPIIWWFEAFVDHLYGCIYVRMIPLAYVTCPEANVSVTVPSLPNDHPFSTKTVLLKEELISCASHTHGLFPDDSTVVYFKLEEATRGTLYVDSIKPFQRRKDGRGGFLAFIW